jgi:uracil-DNA glycosylase family 4
MSLAKPDFCKGCIGYSWSCKEYVPASGTGDNGVLVIAEAAGEHETKEGMPLVGKAGYYLWQNLARVGIEREGFRIHNVLSCRPPNNKLAKESYEENVISYCSPLLDGTITDQQERCRKSGKHFVIVTLGRIAFKRIMGINDKHPIMRQDYIGYPFWSDQYKCWVLAADHPSYLMRGNNHLIPVLQFVFKRALEIADNGLVLDTHEYLLDPAPETFAQWVHDYEHAWTEDPKNIVLSYDIETPYKQGLGEDELAKEDGEDYNILRCSFAYRPNQAVSVPWRAEYRPYLEELFSSPGTKVGWNSSAYDDPRIITQMPIHGDRMDAMLCWHVLNSALDKSLGFVTPFYVQSTSLWKHLSDSEPAFYNAKDADMALRNFLGIRRDLIKNKLWDVLDKHVVQLNRVLTYMSERGVLLDGEMRREAETKLQDLLDVTEICMEAAVPQAARKLKIYKKQPKDTTGMHEVPAETFVKACLLCGELKPKKNHAVLCNGELGKVAFPTIHWAKPLEFKVSKLGLSNYQAVLRHQAIVDRKKQKVTFDESALMKLMKTYPNDPLYPKILEHREYQKLLSTYIGVTQDNGTIRGGMPVGRDGRIHTLFTHNPSTLRLASQNPNLQNLPRPKGSDDLATIIRNLIVAQEGCTFTARDYSGIEAVLVGYFACAPKYIRLAKIDVHSFYTAYALNSLDGRVATADLPDATWPDEKLIPHLAAIKKEFKKDRNELYKHLVHGGNFAQTPKGAAEKIFKETGIEFPVKKIAHVMDVYMELFPEIRRWHQTLLAQAEKDGFLRNPFGYVHRFYKVYSYTKEYGKWIRKPGEDANRVIAFLPQSTAAGIIKEALLRLYFNRFDDAGQYLRLQVHDEIFSEVPEALVDSVDGIKKQEMEKPIVALPLPASYGMGQYLSIDTESKQGYRWGTMK